MHRVYAEDHVFTIAGRIAGEGSEKGAYAIASSSEELVERFRDWGFEITSVASLADVRHNLQILEAIAMQSAEVGPEEYLDLLPAIPGQRRPSSTVFTFVGQYAKASEGGGLLAGFGTAVTGDELSKYLRSLGFDVLSVMSHSEAIELQAEMELVACDAYSDDTHLVNLKDF
ncbi:hypothetical protein QE400_000125 [Xanthomonas sacchari]|uniref:hypothetical protein n=1 Tax=Xanthomonas sacchari TaxID=56458 RepID=UPI0027813776|nr:hypothetical protein [Xanthomonas sacchari]MDQ1090712.1 hypothetical protein [Xanthomonas sacchari]